MKLVKYSHLKYHMYHMSELERIKEYFIGKRNEFEIKMKYINHIRELRKTFKNDIETLELKYDTIIENVKETIQDIEITNQILKHIEFKRNTEAADLRGELRDKYEDFNFDYEDENYIEMESEQNDNIDCFVGKYSNLVILIEACFNEILDMGFENQRLRDSGNGSKMCGINCNICTYPDFKDKNELSKLVAITDVYYKFKYR